MRANEILTEWKEVEFVCVNDQFDNVTSQDSQNALYNALRSIPDIIAYKQDFGEHNSMAVITHDEEDLNSIKQLAQQHGVKIDLINDISSRFVNSIYDNELEGLTDWYAS